MLILTGCAENRALTEAGRTLGVASAGVTIADQPPGCGIDTPHAALHAGEDKLSALKRERAQLDAANGKRADCYLFNRVQIDGLRGPFGPGGPKAVGGTPERGASR